MMLPDEIIERAVKAVESTRNAPEYAVTANEIIGSDHVTARDLRCLQSMILALVANAIHTEFTVPGNWRAVEHRPGAWSLRNILTGEHYRAPARGESTRLVIFHSKAKADLAAYRRNIAETKTT